MWVLDSHVLEEAAVFPKDLVTDQMQQFTLTNLPTCLSVAEPHMLPEMVKEVHQPKGGQEVGHLFITGILNPTDVRVKVPRDNEFPLLEAFDHPL